MGAWLAVCLLAGLPLRAELAQVHVDHSVAARDLINRAGQVGSADPAQAVALLGEVLERYGDEVIEVEAGLYISAGRVVRQRVSQWPVVLQQMKSSWEPLAVEQWQAIADSPEIVEVQRFARRYFFTGVGAAAGERAARLAIEAGQVDLARQEIEDLLRYHPQRDEFGERWRMLLAAALQLAGDAPASLQASPSQPAGESKTADASGSPTSPPQLVQALRPLVSASPAGDLDDKARLAVVWQANLTDRAGYGLNRRQVPPHWLPKPQVLTQPDLVLIQWNRHCFGFDPGTGTLLWDYCPLSEKMSVRAGISGPTMPRRPFVEQGRVYAITEVVLPQSQPGPVVAVQSLACLDAGTGRPYWVRGVGEMMSREVPTVLDGTPVVADGRVYLTARIARTSVYNEVFVLQVDARSGELLGRRHLFGLGRVEQMAAERIKPARLGVRGGVLYIASAAGAVAAIDANSLQPIWVRSFKPQSAAEAKKADEVREPTVPALWADEPLRVDGRLVIPTDASLQVLDPIWGQVLQSIDLDGPVHALAARPGVANQVAAIARKSLYIVDIVAGTIVHKFDLSRGADAVGGLCPLSDGRLLICTEDQVRVLQPDGVAKGLSVDLLAAGIPTVAQGRLYLGINGYLACVADSAKPMADLQQEMKRSDGPLTALRVGELALQVDRSDLAVQALRTAVQRGAADVQRVGEPAVQRLLETCLTFAREYGRRRGDEGRRIAEQLIAIARQCATQPEDKVEMYAILADTRLAHRKAAEAIVAWQEIVADPTLRGTPLPETLGRSGMPSGQWAQAHIDETIQRYGQQAYGELDERAGRLLETARRSGDRKPLDELLQQYPNSKHVPAALLAIGRITLRAGEAAAALEPLRKAACSEDGVSRPEAMLELVRSYQALGNAQAAATWMSWLASVSAEMRFEQAGRTWTAREYAGQLAAGLPRSSQAVCHIGLPLQLTASQTLEDAVWLLPIRAGGTAHRPALAWTAGSLQAFDRRTCQPAWKKPLAIKTQPALLAADDERLVLYDLYGVTAVRADTGQVLWAWAAKGPAPEGPNVDPESVATIQATGATANDILVMTADGQATCIEKSSGSVRWQRPVQPAYIASLSVWEELAVYRASQAHEIVYRVIDMKTGRDVSLWKPSRNLPAESVEILPAGIVLLQGVNAVEAYDAYRGGLVWQVPARNRFRPGMQLRKDTTLYIADGERPVVKIDTLTGQVVWRVIPEGRTGEAVRLVAGDSVIWMIDERGAHLINDATGKVLQTVLLPTEIVSQMNISQATICDAGVLCLATRRANQGTHGGPVSLVLFGYEDKTATWSLVASLEEATGLVSGWDVTDGAVLVAAGNKIIGLQSQANVGR